MAGTVDITLPRSYEPRFPQRCVVCEAREFDSNVRMFAGPLGWWSWLWPGSFSVRVPACTGCARQLHVRRVANLAVTATVTVLVLRYVWPHCREYVPKKLHSPAQIGLAMLCLSPHLAVEILRPSAFGLTAKGPDVDYEFASEDYAHDFMLMNLAAGRLKVNGNPMK